MDPMIPIPLAVIRPALKTLALFALTILLLFTPPIPGNAQQPPELKFEHPLKLDMPLTVAVVQGQDGFLWISPATSGIIKYDGYNITTYTTENNE